MCEADEYSDIHLDVVDIAPRWRAVHRTEVWLRVIGGGIQLLRDLLQVLFAILRSRPDVVHLCTSADLGLVRDVLILQIARWFRVRSIYHLHFGRLPDLTQSGGWECIFIYHAIGLAGTVIVLDTRSFETIRQKCPGQAVQKLPNCANPARLEHDHIVPAVPSLSTTLPRVLFVGWVVAAKGVLDLIAASLQVHTDTPFELEIVGPGDPGFVAAIKQTGAPLGNALHVRGELPHAEALGAMLEADILVLPSHSEGFPIVVIEAMSLGKPVLGTDVGAIREILEGDDDPCGVVVPAKDIDALAKALRRLIRDPDVRRVLGQNAQRRFALQYDCDQVFRSLRQVWLS